MKQYQLFFLMVAWCRCIYDVPSYFGHFSRNYFVADKIREGRFRYFEYHYAVDVDSNNATIYFVNSKKHCIEKFNLINKTKSVLAGACGTPGDRVGGLRVMLLSSPMSVVSYQANQFSTQSQLNMRIEIVANRTCNLSDPGCILPGTIASQHSLSMQNLRPFPQIIQFPVLNQAEKQYLYISDTGNHCIKRIDLVLQTSVVVAGQCGESGFTDGPSGFNKLNRPTSLGISREGILYFYDEGNQYMRRLSIDGEVSTLLNGACKFFNKSRTVGSYVLNNILCYDNWIQFKTKASTQHIIDPAQINFCTDHISKCPISASSLE